MKKTLFICGILLVLYSCETKESVNAELNSLKLERDRTDKKVYSLKEEMYKLEDRKEWLTQQNSKLTKDVKELEAIKSGKPPRYILTLHLKQSHFSIDPMTHIKDAANAVDFQITVDKTFYDSISEGQQVLESFRTGSLVLSGSFGDWEITVIKKQMVYS